MYAIITAVVFAALVVFEDRRRGYFKLPGFKSLNDYFNSEHHWHSWGHFFLQFFLACVLHSFGVPPWVLPIVAFSIAALIEFALQHSSLKEWDTYWDLLTHTFGGLAAFCLYL